MVNNSTIRLAIPCTMCTEVVEVAVDAARYLEHMSRQSAGIRVYMQDSFPDLDPGLREMFISGTCPKCWDLLTGWDEVHTESECREASETAEVDGWDVDCDVEYILPD